MDVSQLEAEAKDLVLPEFTEGTALALGMGLIRMAQEGALPVVIDIRTADRTLFHVALPGSTPLNDLWARRKSNTALLFQLPSFLVGARVEGVGVVAVVTVSGLPQAEDHALVVRAIRAIMPGEGRGV